jgi:hypothetical protein
VRHTRKLLLLYPEAVASVIEEGDFQSILRLHRDFCVWFDKLAAARNSPLRVIGGNDARK